MQIVIAQIAVNELLTGALTEGIYKQFQTHQQELWISFNLLLQLLKFLDL